MKYIIQTALKSMRGSFLRKKSSNDPILKDINKSINDLKYYGIEYDKKNISEDAHHFYKEINNATKEAKIKFKIQ